MLLLDLLEIRVSYRFVIQVLLFLLFFVLKFYFQVIEHLNVMILVISKQAGEADGFKALFSLAKGYQFLCLMDFAFVTNLNNLTLSNFLPWCSLAIHELLSIL